MTLTKPQVTEYRNLKDTGVDLVDTNRICFNEGSEQVPHAVAKQLVGLLGIRSGYRVDSEVPIENDQTLDGETDVLLWGHEQRLTYSIECEQSPTRETIDRKVDQYVRYTAIDDIQVLNLNKLPAEMLDAYGWIGAELGLEP